jgi:hypothetical protein
MSNVAIPAHLAGAAAIGHVVGAEFAQNPSGPLTLAPERALVAAMDGTLTRRLEAAGLDVEDPDVWDAAVASFMIALVRCPLARRAALEARR